MGTDPKGLKKQRGERVSTYMSHQLLEVMEDWVDDMDRLLFLVPIVGSLYKKTYRDEAKKKNASILLNPRDFIINYDATEISTARKTHRLWKLPNTIVEWQNRGLYRKYDEEPVNLPSVSKSDTGDKIQGLVPPGVVDDYSLQELYEIHVLKDFDDDGYLEPYIITIRADGTVYRVVANYTPESTERAEDGRVIAIEPEEFFTHYYFLPDPESKTHGMGFGTMVGPINEAVNTMINILTDAGHLSTLQGGFLSRGIRMKGGAVKFKPGEWKPIQTSGEDLKKGIFPLPVKEPSQVLFELLGLLIDSGKDLASVQDIMVGRNPGQNQPYSTSREVIEQGMKVFNGIYKRLYRSMTSEFKKIFRLNKQFPDIALYKNILDIEGKDPKTAGQIFGDSRVIEFLAADFNEEDVDIIPTAEPDMIQEMQKIHRSVALLEKLGAGLPLNVKEVTRRALEAEQQEDIETLMKVEPKPPPPEIRLQMAEFEHKKKIDSIQIQLSSLETRAKVLVMNNDAELKNAEAQNLGVKDLHTQFMEEQKLIKDEFDAVTKRLKVLSDDRKTEQDRKAGGETAKPAGENQ